MITKDLHKELLVKILKEIFSNADIAGCLAFKGGTAAMLFYGLDRMSVDLDFDLLNESHANEVFLTVNEILEKYGVVKEASNKRFNLFFLLSYENKVKNAHNIKVDINKRAFGSSYKVEHYLGIPMKVMVEEDMAAHKLVAMYQRIGKASRDIYDVWFFLQNSWPINKKIIEQRMEMSYKEFLKKCIEVLEKLPDRNILDGVGELLKEKQKAWARTKLRTETIFLLSLALSNED